MNFTTWGYGGGAFAHYQATVNILLDIAIR
jgi:hypothetical protein